MRAEEFFETIIGRGKITPFGDNQQAINVGENLWAIYQPDHKNVTVGIHFGTKPKGTLTNMLVSAVFKESGEVDVRIRNGRIKVGSNFEHIVRFFFILGNLCDFRKKHPLQ